jgi:hypothetical protein
VLKKNIVSGLLFCVFATFPLNAANVSFLVMETGLPEESRSSQYSVMWENGLLEIFFDYGHIVSNAPLMRIFDKPDGAFPSEAERDFEGAKAGGMDFFIIAIIDYTPPRGAENPRPQNVILRLFNTKSEQMIREQIYSNVASRSTGEEYENIKKAVAVFAANLRRDR